MPKGFSLFSDSTNSSPQQVSKVRAVVLPFAHRKEPSLGRWAVRTLTPRPPASSLPAGLALPTPHHSAQAARVPHSGRNRKQPYNKQGDGTGRPRPGAHRLGATPHLRRGPLPQSEGAGRQARGRQVGMKGGRRCERGGGLLGTQRRSEGAGAGSGRPGRTLPSSCPRSGSKRSTGT